MNSELKNPELKHDTISLQEILNGEYIKQPFLLSKNLYPFILNNRIWTEKSVDPKFFKLYQTTNELYGDGLFIQSFELEEQTGYVFLHPDGDLIFTSKLNDSRMYLYSPEHNEAEIEIEDKVNEILTTIFLYELKEFSSGVENPFELDVADFKDSIKEDSFKEKFRYKIKI